MAGKEICQQAVFRSGKELGVQLNLHGFEALLYLASKK
jgi:hypothetical protein